MIPLDVNIIFLSSEEGVGKRERVGKGKTEGGGGMWGKKGKRWGRSRGRGMGGEGVKLGGVWKRGGV
jgi:hypothetical protein